LGHSVYTVTAASVEIIQFNSNCPTLTPKVTRGKKLSQCREYVFKQKRFQFMPENVRSLLFPELHRAGCSKLSARHGKMVFAKLQPSCQRFITVSNGRSDTYGIVSVILGLAIFVQFRLVTDRQTHDDS